MLFLPRYFAILLESMYVLKSAHTADKFSFVLYGVAVGSMWLRTLHFVLVQKELGQVPPCMGLHPFAPGL